MIKRLTIFIILAVSTYSNAETNCPEHFSFTARALHSSSEIDICQITSDKPVLIVNTASFCGFTRQFKDLEALHNQYQQQDLIIIGFPSDSFSQESDDEKETAEICYKNFGVTFTMLSTTDVKGDKANKLFKHLESIDEKPSWNFNKYLFDRRGELVEHFGSTTSPTSSKMQKAIKTVL